MMTFWIRNAKQGVKIEMNVMQEETLNTFLTQDESLTTGAVTTQKTCV